MQQNSSIVSIIVPVYNVEEYIRQCVESIIGQSYKEIEIILIDDGSTDSSGEICDEYAKKDSRVQVVHKNNSGLVSARQTGLERATGKYVGFVDGDDYIDESMFQDLVSNMENTGADFVHTGYLEDQEKKACFESAVIDFGSKGDKIAFLREYVLNCVSKKRISPSIWSKLFKAELIKESYKAVPVTQMVGEDWINLTECVLQSNRISLLDIAEYHYTVRRGSLSHPTGSGELTWQPGFYKAIEDILKNHGCYETEKRYLNELFMHLIKPIIYSDFKDRFQMIRYRFKRVDLLLGKNIVLYGAGAVGRDYYSQLCRYSGSNIVAWVDSDYANIHYEYTNVIGKDNLKLLDFDYLVIAVKSRSSAEEIRKMLIGEGVEYSKIIWEEPQDAFKV